MHQRQGLHGFSQVLVAAAGSEIWLSGEGASVPGGYKRGAQPPSQEGCFWIWGQSYEGQFLPASPPCLSHLSAPPQPLCVTCSPRRAGGWSETPVAVHGEQDDFACVVEPGLDTYTRPLPGGHDRCDCVPCPWEETGWSLAPRPGRPHQGLVAWVGH